MTYGGNWKDLRRDFDTTGGTDVKRLSIWEFEELALYLCGIQAWEMSDPPEVDIDDVLLEKFDVDFIQFAKIAQALLPLAILAGPGTGGLNYEVRQGFGNSGVFFVKQTVTDPDLLKLAGA